jgi:hypothetical protein
MNIRRLLIVTSFYVPYLFHKITRTGAFGSQKARYVDSVMKSEGNSLKSALVKHHVKQFNEASCSVAAVVSVINAIREGWSEKQAAITQMEILERVKTANWKKRMSKKGDNGKRGLPLPILADVVKSSLDAYGIDYRKMEMVQAIKNSKETEEIKKVLYDRLIDFETKGNCVIIAHFDQGAFVPTLNIPHISPVGGFDSEQGLVTILDVGSSQKKFYAVSFATFYKGLSSNYLHALRPFGFSNGGYIYIKVH